MQSYVNMLLILSQRLYIAYIKDMYYIIINNSCNIIDVYLQIQYSAVVATKARGSNRNPP